MHPAFHAHPDTAIPLVLLTAKELGPWTREQPDRVKRLVDDRVPGGCGTDAAAA
jgi:hypothetical protein